NSRCFRTHREERSLRMRVVTVDTFHADFSTGVIPNYVYARNGYFAPDSESGALCYYLPQHTNGEMVVALPRQDGFEEFTMIADVRLDSRPRSGSLPLIDFPWK